MNELNTKVEDCKTAIHQLKEKLMEAVMNQRSITTGPSAPDTISSKHILQGIEAKVNRVSEELKLKQKQQEKMLTDIN